MLRFIRRALVVGALIGMTGWTGAARAAEPPSVTQLEKEIAALRAEVEALRAQGGPAAERLNEIERQIAVLAQEIETMKLGEAAATADRSNQGMGPAASKIYHSGNGFAAGGYGEVVYHHFDGKLQDGSRSDATDEADLQRAVLYFGYKFNDRFLFNSELEIEHAVTASDKDGETEVEFAYADYLWKPQANLRAGLLLMPVGLLNEYHEPTVFLGMNRNFVETAIIPTTWREIGFGLYGEAGPWRYRTYVTNGLDASRFAADGLGEGSGEGSHAKAEDLAWVGRLDFTGVAGLLAGGSVFTGDSGQGLLDDAGRRIGGRVTLYEGHLDWRWRGLQFRALGVRSRVGDAAAIDRALGLEGEEGIGKAQRGAYAEAGFDLLSLRPGSRQRLIPFVRYESYDTQSEVPAGFERNPANDVRVLTFGFNYYPIDQLVLKTSILRVRNEARTGQNEIQIGLGYVF
ncbi:MAG TPA: porin [Thermoanaerobaculia bacterium]|nr:porin [Thermoanaerobaculia bacterium]